MRIEQIGPRAVLHQGHKGLVRLPAIFKPGPEADGPSAAPACIRAARCQPPFERHPRRSGQFRRTARRDLRTRIQRVQMRHVPLPGLGFPEVLRPLLQLPVLTHLIRKQPRPRLREPSAKFRLDAQHFARFDAVREQFLHQRHVHGAARARLRALALRRQKRILRGERRARRQPAILIFDQPVETELRRTLHHRPRPLLQECLIAGELVMLPEVRAEPRTAHLPVGPRRGPATETPHRRRLPPHVRVVM